MVDQRLRELRISKGFSVKQMAMVLNVTVDAYSAMESGIEDIGIKLLQLLCDFFEVSISHFFDGQLKTKTPTVVEEKPEPAVKKSKPVARSKSNRSKTQAKGSDWRANPYGDPDRGGRKLKKSMDEHPEIPAERAGIIELFSRIIVDITLEEMEDKCMLASTPEGYHPEKKKACQICKYFGSGKAMWYDAFGYKCMVCQNAINKGIIPAEVADNTDLYYTDSTLDLYFNLNGRTLKAWIKAGLLRPREIMDDDSKSNVHYRLFLLSDHQGFLPPLDLLRIGHPVRETDENGRTEYVLGYPWYYFVDPAEHLKDYGIMKYMGFTREESDTRTESPFHEEGEED